MSGLSATKLNSPDKLEIAWYPEDHPPRPGFDYDGTVYVDNVRLTDDQNRVATTKCFRKRRSLERSHGLKVNTLIQSETATVQDGVFKHDDGTQIPYTIEMLSGGRRMDFDGESFYFEVDSN